MPPANAPACRASRSSPRCRPSARLSMLTSRSVPAADVTFMRLLPRSMRAAARDLSFQRGDRAHALQRFGVLVRDHHDAGAGLQDLRRLGRMHQAFERAIDHEAGLRRAPRRPARACRSRRWRRSSAPAPDARLRGVGTTTWNGRAPRRSKRKFRQMHVELTRLRLGENGGGVALLHRAFLEQLAEGVDPLSFDAIGQHQLSSGNPRSRRARSVLKPAFSNQAQRRDRDDRHEHVDGLEVARGPDQQVPESLGRG